MKGDNKRGIFKELCLDFIMNIIIHYNEIATKGKNRNYFERFLMRNLQNTLRGFVTRVYKRYGLIVVEVNNEKEEIKNKLFKVSGIANFSFSVKAELNFNNVKEKTLEIAKEKEFSSFKVNARRSNKNFPKTSKEINKEIGDLIREKLDKKVDLSNPDLELFIEVGEKEVFLYYEKFSGIGGLPVGVSGKLVSSLSGGIDSPIASYLMMKRGCEIIFVHIFNKNVSGEGAVGKIEKIVNVLKEFQGKTELYIVPFEELQKEIIKNVPAELRMIVYRRYMMRILNSISLGEKAGGIVTGDSLGQVASQTLENLGLIHNVPEVPVFSPLIGMNKDEIINIARNIGTYEFSILPYEDCCSFMIAEHPETKGRLEEIEKFEKRIDEKIVENVVDNSRILRF